MEASVRLRQREGPETTDENVPEGTLSEAGSEAPERALRWNPGQVPEGKAPGWNMVSEQVHPEG